MADCVVQVLIEPQGEVTATVESPVTEVALSTDQIVAEVSAEVTQVLVENPQTIVVEVPTTPPAVGYLPRIRQVPLGVIDGVNTVFTTVDKFVHNGLIREEVYLRGLLREEGVGCDYVASESGGVGTGYDTITFAKAPRPGDILLITYFLA